MWSRTSNGRKLLCHMQKLMGHISLINARENCKQIVRRRACIMNDAPIAPRESQKFVFSSPEGRTLCKRIIQARIPYEPHDVQVEGVCKMLDQVDLFAILPTGSGKTSFLSMYMFVVLAIREDPSLCPTVSFPENPCMRAVCPTKYLEHQMVR